MRLKKQHAQYIGRKITKDLINCNFIEIRKDKAAVTAEIERIIIADIANEAKLDEHVAAL